MGVYKSKGGMGFCDLESFNKAFLANQCWHILHNPDSLSAKILKTKHFQQETFLDAKLGHQPSYGWRSMWSAKELLKAGLVWRVRNGDKIRVHKDKWLPLNVAYNDLIPRVGLSNNARVAKLINWDYKWWKVNILRELFEVDNALII
jgi:hypothetical protein